MKITRIVSQDRRDFIAIYECEGCAAAYEGPGYDDTYFHQHVIPNAPCPECGQTSKTLGADCRPLTPRHPDGVQI